MNKQKYQLSEFSSIFKKIQKDKKKSTLQTLEFILELNKSIKFDQILVRQGFQVYPNKSILQSKRSQQLYLDYFKYLKQNLDVIESSYLKNTNDLKLIQEAQINNKVQYNFLLNKNSVSKFIRDEATHYQNILDKYLQLINQGQQQKGIKTKNIHSFIIDLFNNKYIIVIHQNKLFFKKQIIQIQINIGLYLLQYAKKIRQFTQEQAKQQYFISQEQILDFLTFWLKQQKNIFILYARTQQRLAQQSKFITNQSHLDSKIHPSRMTAAQIIKKEQQIKLEIQNQQNNSKSQIIEQKIQQKKQKIKTPDLKTQIKSEGSKLIEIKELQNPQIKNKQKSQHKSKQDLIKPQIKSLFQFGCKRRYNLNKNSTFQDIQQQSQTMTFQKFMNFCNFFQLTTIINKELISQYFKMFAINLRILDFSRFEKTITKMAKVDERIYDNLLKKNQFQLNLRQNHIKKNKKSQGRLSNYKFILYPVNGKDVSTIQKQLSFKKLQKMIFREEKQKDALTKREKLQRQPSKVNKVSNRANSNSSFSKVTPIQLQSIRDINFNPQKLISNNEKDKLWQAYEAKIWSKDSRAQSTLQSILSKRIQRGKYVINKFNSQRSFIYDQ